MVRGGRGPWSSQEGRGNRCRINHVDFVTWFLLMVRRITCGLIAEINIYIYLDIYTWSLYWCEVYWCALYIQRRMMCVHIFYIMLMDLRVRHLVTFVMSKLNEWLEENCVILREKHHWICCYIRNVRNVLPLLAFYAMQCGFVFMWVISFSLFNVVFLFQTG